MLRQMLRSGLRLLLAVSLPGSMWRRGPALAGTAVMAKLYVRSLFGGPPVMMVNVGACDGMMFDDVTPWLARIPRARALFVEPIPYNVARLRANFPDESRFMIEQAAVVETPGPIAMTTFDPAAIESGALPIEFQGASTTTGTNIMGGQDSWGRKDENYERFKPHIRSIEVEGVRLADILARRDIAAIDVFVIDVEGADWTVLKQFDVMRFRPRLIKVEIAALSPAEIGEAIVFFKRAGYDASLYREDIWAFAA
jgi:FkbM family methyltransferase